MDRLGTGSLEGTRSLVGAELCENDGSPDGGGRGADAAYVVVLGVETGNEN